MKIVPNILAECLLAALRFATLWLIFWLLHHPRTQLRRVMAVVVMALQFPLCRTLFFASGRNFAVSIACDTLLFLALAFICEPEPAAEPATEPASSRRRDGEISEKHSPAGGGLYRFT